jgi:hypothetical protein
MDGLALFISKTGLISRLESADSRLSAIRNGLHHRLYQQLKLHEFDFIPALLGIGAVCSNQPPGNGRYA